MINTSTRCYKNIKQLVDKIRMVPEDTIEITDNIQLAHSGMESWSYPNEVTAVIGRFRTTDYLTIEKITFGYEIIIKPRYLLINDDVLCYAPSIMNRNIVEFDNIGTRSPSPTISEI